MNLHNEIMNLPSRMTRGEFLNQYDYQAYKEGHRDARHDAAELSLKYEAYIDSLESLVKSAGVHTAIIESIKKEKLNVCI